MISISYYKIFGPNKLGALVVNKKAIDIIMNHPLLNSSLLESDSTHGGTQSISLSASALNSLQVANINRENKNKRLLKLREYLEQLLSQSFTCKQYTDMIPFNPSSITKKWVLIIFSPIRYSVPNTFMFSFIRKIGTDTLDAPCGKKLTEYFAQNNIIVSNGSACG